MKLPDLSDLVLLRVAARGLSLNAHRSAMAQLYGGHRSAQRGRGLEFEEVRPYVPGDDARTIDWRVTARRGKPHTKLFREERERPVWIVADLHSGLFFGSKRQFKSAVLLQAAALLAWVAALGGGREAGVLPILQALVEGQPRAPDAPVQTGLQTALTTLRPLLQPGSLVLLLSDFAQVDPPLQDMLAGIARQNDCRLLWLTDPLERNGLPAGEHRVGLPQRLWWVNGEASRDAWQAAWTERQARLTAMAEALNLPLVRLDTADALSDNLVALIKEPRWAL